MGLPNHVGDVEFGVHDLAEFAPVGLLQKLKNRVIHITRHPDRADILSV